MWKMKGEPLRNWSGGSYAANIGAIIAKEQINNGGKVILYQPENEYR
jgi:hypothetical protein